MHSYGHGDMSKLAKILTARATAWAAQRANDEIGRGDLRDEDDLGSGIHESPVLSNAPTPTRRRSVRHLDPALLGEVTLVVYAWHNVQPGAMSWVFPNARQAIAAAKAMRNAVAWAIVRGKQPGVKLDAARAVGDVLLEHSV
jgi:hypothetical protein